MLDIKEFQQPSSEFRLKPFWFWNSRLDTKELLAQIRDMHAHGVGGFFIHARFGLETEYLSPEWFQAIRVCLEEAGKLGMEVWLYDENPFPSGIGDQKVSSRREYRNRYIEYIRQPLHPGENIIPVGDGEVICVLGLQNDSYRAIPYEALAGRIILHAGDASGTVAIFIKRLIDNPNGKIFGINYMNPEAVRFYIATTHEQYRKHLGQYFGNVIKGIFTDEPTLLPWHQDLNWYIARGDGYLVPWDEQIPERLLRKYGYDVEALMRGIFLEDNLHAEEIRRHFWQEVAQLYEQNFFKIYKDWCDENGLLLTGHVLLEEGLYFNTIFQGNILRNLEYFDMPGVDHLTNTAEETNAEFLVGKAPHLPRIKTNVQGQKLVVSAAHLSGKRRILSESFGIGGWSLTLEDMKWIVNWQYVLGINQICPHAFFYSIEGFRKGDAPPCHMHNSSWRNYRLFADYVARLSYALSAGGHKADVAILYPLRAFQGAYMPGEQRDRDKAISDVYDMLCVQLPKLHYDYDIIGEHHLLKARIEGDSLKLEDEAFRVLLLPSLEGLSGEVLGQIRRFIRAGGNVLVFHDRSEGKSSATFELQKPGQGICRTVRELDLDNKEDQEFFKRILADFLEKVAPKDISIMGDRNEQVYCYHRHLEDEELYFFTNTSRTKAVSVDISLKAPGRMVIYDLESGKVIPWKPCTKTEDSLTFRYDFVPCGSLLLGVRAEKFDGSVAETEEEEASMPQLTLPMEGWTFELEGYNALPLNEWQLSFRNHSGGTDYIYKTFFFVRRITEPLLLMMDDIEYRHAFMGLMNMEIRINQIEVPNPSGYYIEKKFKTFDISHCIKEGENRIEIVIHHSAWSDRPQLLTSPAKLLGRFSLQEAKGCYWIDEMPETVMLKSWTEQGYPFFSGTGVYRCTFHLDDVPGYALLRLSELADCVEVWVNGQPAGTRIWRPWEVDISSQLRQGKNELTLKVTNSLVNFIEGEKKASGILGSVYIQYKSTKSLLPERSPSQPV
jgi:hypothetical protein